MFAPVSLEFSTIDADTAGNASTRSVTPTLWSTRPTRSRSVRQSTRVSTSQSSGRSWTSPSNRRPSPRPSCPRAAVHRRCLPLPHSSTRQRSSRAVALTGEFDRPFAPPRHRRRSHPPPGVAVRRPDAFDREAPGAGARDRPADPEPGPRSGRTRSPGATERDRPLGHPRGPGRPDLQPERPAGRTVGVRQPAQRRRLAPDACTQRRACPLRSRRPSAPPNHGSTRRPSVSACGPSRTSSARRRHRT